MSLETVLHIGRELRKSKDNLRHFKAVEPCPTLKDGSFPICFNIPVKDDFSFDWSNISIVPENKREQLYYLKYKSSGNDSGVKYVFGDIFFQKTASIDNKGEVKSENGGYFKLNDFFHSQPFQRKNSIERGTEDYTKISLLLSSLKSEFDKFHDSILDNYLNIESILGHGAAVEQYILENGSKNLIEFISNINKLKESTIQFVYNSTSKTVLKKLGLKDNELFDEALKEKLYLFNNTSIFLHFEFENGKSWYELNDIFKAIKIKMLSDFADKTENGLVLTKTLYKTLCSGDNSNDIQFPKFTNKNKHKAKSFTDDSLEDLFYAVDFASKGRFIKGTDIKRIVLPMGKELQAEDYINFLQNKDEGQISLKNENIEEPLFSFLAEKNPSITSFDLIFCKKGAGAGTPHTDLIEISGIEKSKLQMTMSRIREISSVIMKERKNYLKTNKDLFDFRIENSFQNILGTPQYDEKTKKVSIKVNPKYESHLLKVLILIYTDTYTSDAMLLPAFIQNVEYSVRSGDEKFTFLQFDLKFLYKIQNIKNDKFTDMINSQSYQIGLLLGSLSKNLTLEINSFEKNYVGTLLRRIGNLPDFIKMKNDVEQKLIMHDKTKYTFQVSYDLAQRVKEFDGFYDKEECDFGFFESYFKPIEKKAKQE